MAITRGRKMDRRKRQMTIDGLPVFDANKSITVEILVEDVRKGKKLDPGQCAAALACKREFKVKEAYVNIGRTYIRQKDHWLRYTTSASLAREIAAVDKGGRFSPGEYTLGKMQPSREHDVTRDKGARTKPKKVRMPYHLTADVRRLELNP